ncbi:hypothetical protein NECID01_0453 [Nematocida sp. AWRm77]|nr:hypothetical protein NECID01_0453 [Nematocida sp. AWRm77]
MRKLINVALAPVVLALSMNRSRAVGDSSLIKSLTSSARHQPKEKAHLHKEAEEKEDSPKEVLAIGGKKGAASALKGKGKAFGKHVTAKAAEDLQSFEDGQSFFKNFLSAELSPSTSSLKNSQDILQDSISRYFKDSTAFPKQEKASSRLLLPESTYETGLGKAALSKMEETKHLSEVSLEEGEKAQKTKMSLQVSSIMAQLKELTKDVDALHRALDEPKSDKLEAESSSSSKTEKSEDVEDAHKSKKGSSKKAPRKVAKKLPRKIRPVKASPPSSDMQMA